jgi:hypothetical protein
MSDNKAVSAWGKANPLRGADYHALAIKFIRDFPIGTTLDNDKFDSWAEAQRDETGESMLKVPHGYPTHSDEWLAHVTRRNQLRANLYKASTHPRMHENGGQCYVLTRVAQGVMTVEASSTALTQSHFANKLDTLVNTKRQHLGYLMQSADLARLPPEQRAIAENLYTEISDWNDVLQLQTRQMDARFGRLVAQIRHDVEAGRTTRLNHGIDRMLELDSTAADDSSTDRDDGS